MNPTLFLFALTACAGGQTPSETTPATSTAQPAKVKPEVIDVVELNRRMSQGKVTLIDVRTTGEFAGGHVPGAVNIPLDQIEGRLSELEPYRDQPLHVICAVGGRSAQAVDVLASKGFSAPVNVDGGTNGWIKSGFPVE